MLTTQTTDMEPVSNPSNGFPGVGGTAPGIVAGIGVRNRVVGFAAEFSLPARFETVQEMRHGIVEQIDNRYRDSILSALVIARVAGGKVGLELVGGVSFVDQSIVVRFADCGTQFNPQPCSAYSEDIERSAWTWGITFGGDVPVRVAARFAIVPQIRVHMVPSRGFFDNLPDLRVSSFVFRPAVAGRWTF